MPLEKEFAHRFPSFVTILSSFFQSDGGAFLWFGPLLLVGQLFFQKQYLKMLRIYELFVN